MENINNIQNNTKDAEIYQEIKQLITSAQLGIYHYANFRIVQTYWEIGKILFEKCGESEQGSRNKANIRYISELLTKEYGKGFNATSLRFMRKFYCTYPLRSALQSEVSWTHYKLLLTIKNSSARTFYENETIKNRWSSRQLERQIKSHYYERIVSNQTQKQLVHNKQSIDYTPIIKDPYILDFLSLPNTYQEKDLEEALCTKLNTFLTELGRGYSFIGRQVPIVIDGSRYYIDLVFHNNLLNCDVLFELKVRSTKPTDLGQLQMYLNYYKKNLVVKGDNPPIGILLCSNKNDLVVEYSLPEDNESIYVSKYLDYLPSKEEFKKILNDKLL